MNKVFTDQAWEEYRYWQNTDKKIVQKINALLQDIDRNGNEGLAKPEPLKHELAGFWSRRIYNIYSVYFFQEKYFGKTAYEYLSG